MEWNGCTACQDSPYLDVTLLRGTRNNDMGFDEEDLQERCQSLDIFLSISQISNDEKGSSRSLWQGFVPDVQLKEDNEYDQGGYEAVEMTLDLQSVSKDIEASIIGKQQEESKRVSSGDSSWSSFYQDIQLLYTDALIIILSMDKKEDARPFLVSFCCFREDFDHEEDRKVVELCSLKHECGDLHGASSVDISEYERSFRRGTSGDTYLRFRERCHKVTMQRTEKDGSWQLSDLRVFEVWNLVGL
jgi:hypothetical protein